jgi:hypothetical protein
MNIVMVHNRWGGTGLNTDRIQQTIAMYAEISTMSLSSSRNWFWWWGMTTASPPPPKSLMISRSVLIVVGEDDVVKLRHDLVLVAVGR